MQLQRILLAREVQHPNDVDHGEDEPARAHRLERTGGGVDPAVDAIHGKYNSNGAKYGDLEPVHGDGIRR
jgi:hypothetical protein